MFRRTIKYTRLQAAQYHKDERTFIVSALRTPIGSCMGSLSGISTSRLGGSTVKAALARAAVNPKIVKSASYGIVAAGYNGYLLGRQASIIGGLSSDFSCNGYDNFCTSGASSVYWGDHGVQYGSRTWNSISVTGGFESMSKSPQIIHGYDYVQNPAEPIKDGFWDFYNDYDLGNFVEEYAKKNGITRDDQDNYTIESYRRAAAAWADGRFLDEIVPVSIPQEDGSIKVVSEDERIKDFDSEKVRLAKPIFHANGSITAANSCRLSDGAAVLILASRSKILEHKLRPIGRISYVFWAPMDEHDLFSAPVASITGVLKKSSYKQSRIDYFEISDTFSTVSLATIKALDLDPARVNAHGGTLSLGHPMGATGARVIVTLLNVLRKNKQRIGVACVSDMSGGACAFIVESLS